MLKPAIKWIGTDGDYYPNRADSAGNLHKPIAIVMHIMQGTLLGTDSHFNNPKVDASTHFGIGKDGTIHQYVSLEHGAWGNGRVQNGSWSILSQFPGVNPNLYTISIEHEGTHPEPGFYQFTDAQYDADIKLVAWICDLYGIPCDRDHVIGHYQIDSVDRPNCPGPTYDFDRVIRGAKVLLDSRYLSDISGHWAQKVIERVAATGVMTGYPDGTFKPDQPMTRAEAAVLVDRILNYKE